MPTDTFDLEVFLKALVMPDDLFHLDQCKRILKRDPNAFYVSFEASASPDSMSACLRVVVEALWRAELRILRLTTYLDLPLIETESEEEVTKLLEIVNDYNATSDIVGKVFIQEQNDELIGSVSISFVVPVEFDVDPEIQKGLSILVGHNIIQLINEMAAVSMSIHEEMNGEEEEESLPRFQ